MHLSILVTKGVAATWLELAEKDIQSGLRQAGGNGLAIDLIKQILFPTTTIFLYSRLPEG